MCLLPNAELRAARKTKTSILAYSCAYHTYLADSKATTSCTILHPNQAKVREQHRSLRIVLRHIVFGGARCAKHPMCCLFYRPPCRQILRHKGPTCLAKVSMME